MPESRRSRTVFWNVRRCPRFILWLLGLTLFVFKPSCQADEAFFEKSVRPLLVKRCYSCHAGAKAGGGLSLETAAGWKKGGESGIALVPGKPDESLLIQAINYRSLEMPPRDKGGQLTAEEITILTKWVALGAPDPRTGPALGGMTQTEAAHWWSFQPLPDVTGSPAVAQLDEFLQAPLSEHQLSASPPADKRTLIRRATYDLTGIPPTPAEVAAFLADDSPEAFLRVIDRLLASPQYGVQWGRHWLDVVRYADTAGENTDRPLPHAWRYRNWVIEAFNRDLPFDEFVRLQLCGDLVSANREPAERMDGIIATGYLAIARRFGHDIDKDIYLTHEDVIDNLGKNLLGLTLGCARCHDHKYDAVTTADYYALSGVLQSTRFAFPGCEPKGQPRDLVPLIEPQLAAKLSADFQRRLADYEQRQSAAPKEARRLKPIAAAATRVLAAAAVGEGASVVLHEGRDGRLDRIQLKKDEVLQLTILPNANHGADTTRVELSITRLDGPAQTNWSTTELIPQFLSSGPAIKHAGATWCLLDVADGPLYLQEKKRNLNGKAGLHAWSIGDTPSSVVNAADQPVAVWTTLPARSFFLHPGHYRNVALAWVCPEAGEYSVRGLVADAHPTGLDGVSFRLEHIASTEYGQGLMTQGSQQGGTPLSRPEPPVIPVAYAVVDAAAKNARMHLRGDPEKFGEEIPRRWLSVFGGSLLTSPSESGRRELAERIIEQPLLARVMVNRIWQGHFGRGIVATPNDFGARGASPTHPALLNWLAAHFRQQGYLLKPIHRLIMQSAAYQRASTVDPQHAEHDAENRWLARFSRRRLTAEELRDSLLFVSGQLDPSPGMHHPFPSEAEWRYTQHSPFTAVYETKRRSAYLMVQRQRRHPYLALFDGADPNSSTATRQATTVPTQALYFLNDPFFHQQAAAVVATLDPQAADTDRLQTLAQRLFQRNPTTVESELAASLLANHPGTPAEKWSAWVRVWLASNEFLYLD